MPPERMRIASRTPAPSSKATRAAMWLPAKAQPMQRRIRTAMWRGNWVGAGGVMVGGSGSCLHLRGWVFISVVVQRGSAFLASLVLGGKWGFYAVV